MEERIGKVKFFHKQKGYGFIVDQETGEEFFCHFSVIDTTFPRKILYKGWMVRFTVGELEDGKVAVTWVKADKSLVKKDEKKEED